MRGAQLRQRHAQQAITPHCAHALEPDLRGVGSDPLLAGWFAGRGELLAELLPSALAGFIEARPPWKRRA